MTPLLFGKYSIALPKRLTSSNTRRMPPGKSNDDLISTLCSGMWRLRYQLPRESRCRVFDELFPALHDAKQRVLGVRDDDSYYLGYIGTKATSRGMGYATRLIQHIASMVCWE